MRQSHLSQCPLSYLWFRIFVVRSRLTNNRLRHLEPIKFHGFEVARDVTRYQAYLFENYDG
jgi:hypothetical protein